MIPARYDSSRFPGKPLAQLAGRPLIEWTWRAAMRARLPVFVVTDSPLISDVASMFGARVILTPQFCQNGTERCAWALGALKGGIDVVVNWQGDAPLIPPDFASAVSGALLTSMDHDVATLAVPGRSHDGQVRVFEAAGLATGFFRTAEPWGRPVLQHVGMYAYRGDALRRYGETPSLSEKAESLEQNRWIDREIPVALIHQDAPPYELREVNHPCDVDPVSNILRQIHEID